jgi:phospholipid/cholesterol/gamma-HCH transport system substrate-binding protein
MTAPLNPQPRSPFKLAGSILVVFTLVVIVLVYLQFRGDFLPRTQLTMLADRSGLSMSPGAKVTYNGVQIGRVTDISEVTTGDKPEAKFLLAVDPKYLKLIPANVDAKIEATTIFGPKYVSFTLPKNPDSQRITSSDVIDVSSVTDEFNTLFQTVTSLTEKVDPVKLNQTLSALAEALNGQGAKFAQAIRDGNAVLADVNPRIPTFTSDISRLADVADIYTQAAPDLIPTLGNLATTGRTLTDERGNLDAALMGAIGFGNSGEDVFTRGEPFFVRALSDLIPTTKLLDEYSPELFCTVRNFHDINPAVAAAVGGNGYSLNTTSEILFADNPYVYPDNLPKVNARGGPGGKPGCWQPISRDLWPAPWLVMDTGNSIAPYNHFALGQPLMRDYLYGRQLGENTINP